MVGGDGLDRAVIEPLPERLLILLRPKRRRADIPRRLAEVLFIVAGFVQRQIMRAGFHIDLLASGSRGHDLGQRLLRAQVNDHDRRIGDLADTQQMRHRLSLRRVRAALGMRARHKLPIRLMLLNERVDHACVFAVHTRDAAVFFDLLQCVEQVLVADHHRGIRHVHLERRNPLLEHSGYLSFNFVVPVVDRHVEAVVAARPAVGLLVPEVEAVLQALALVRAGEIDDHRRAAANGAARAGVKVVRRRRIAHVKVKMRVRVDKAREQELSRHIDHVRFRARDMFRDPLDLLAVYQHVQLRRAAAGHHDTALE